MKKLLLIDCYDSYTDILAQSLEDTGLCSVEICAWDKVNKDCFNEYDAFVLSPGPGLPEEYPDIFEYLKLLTDKHVLGVCMGHQIMALSQGGKLVHLGEVVHGKSVKVYQRSNTSLYSGVPDGFSVGLYHSWVIENLPLSFELIGISENDRIMIIQHKEYNWTGFQFHPESYITVYGRRLLANWLMMGDRSM